ncbi:MAG: hypothetical protein ACK5K7_01565 [Bacilli bacterium]
MISKAIIGICKNAGKTTVLKHHLRNSDINYAITSIGLDGESRDQIFNNSKPRIFVKENTIIATSINSLKKSDVTYEVLNMTNIMTPLGYIAIVNTLSAGYVEIAGTSNASDLLYIKNWVNKHTNTDILYIDGALSRKQFSSIDFIDEVDIVIGAAFNQNMAKTLDEAILWNRLYSIKKYDFNPGSFNVIINDKKYKYDFIDVETLSQIVDVSTNFVFLDCIITSDAFNYILTCSKQNKIKLVVENSNKLFINLNDFNKLLNSNLELFVRKKINISGIYINPYGYGFSYDSDEFKTSVENIFNYEAINVGEQSES